MKNPMATIIVVFIAALFAAQASYAAEAFCQNAYYQEGGQDYGAARQAASEAAWPGSCSS